MKFCMFIISQQSEKRSSLIKQSQISLQDNGSITQLPFVFHTNLDFYIFIYRKMTSCLRDLRQNSSQLDQKLLFKVLPPIIFNAIQKYSIYINQMEEEKEESFDIAWIQGVDYTQETRLEFEKAIKDNFCLLSWLVPDYGIKIIYEVTSPKSPGKKIKIFTNSIGENVYVLYERKVQEGFHYYFENFTLRQEQVKKKQIQQRQKLDIKAKSRQQTEDNIPENKNVKHQQKLNEQNNYKKDIQTKSKKQVGANMPEKEKGKQLPTKKKQNQPKLKDKKLESKQIKQMVRKISQKQQLTYRTTLEKNQKQKQSLFVSFQYESSNNVFLVRRKEVIGKGLSFEDVFLSGKGLFPSTIEKSYNFFNPPCRKIEKTITGEKEIKQDEVEYNYIEPYNRRNYQPKGYHLSLAFQGGGAKGVSYVGVYKAIKKTQERINRESSKQINIPITSVIGSSAGGILALAISAGISESDLQDLCYMMNTLVEDRFIQRDPRRSEQQKDQKQQNGLSAQRDYLKFFLHNIGLIQTNLFDIFEETLLDPSIQQLLYKIIAKFNPSLASLLTFDDQQKKLKGEAIKNCCGTCCCCCYSNCCSCFGLYPSCRDSGIAKCFVKKVQQVKKLNIYGLLQAALMTGEAVQNILAFALSCFVRNLVESKDEQNQQRKQTLRRIGKEKQLFELNFPDNQQFENGLIQNHKKLVEINQNGKYRLKHKQEFEGFKLIKLVKSLTMKDYYALTGVEFTVTSVDLHDKILRFFNHKTTPLLPVCKAVQMTGSFPVAFQALSWKSEWGKYYIHYDKTRREIDLTGHQFTDGGLLANFPLKFLDNEKFREKYFSHKMSKRTYLYGFGLDKLEDFPEDDPNHKPHNEQQNEQDSSQSLFHQLFYRLIYKFAFYAIKCGNKNVQPDQPQQPAQQPPPPRSKLLLFAFQLVEALQQSDRNLNKQCFSDEIIESIVYDQFKTKLSKQKGRQGIEIIKFDQIKTSLEKNIQTYISMVEKDYPSMLVKQLSAIYSQFQEYDKKTNNEGKYIEKTGEPNKRYSSRKLNWMQLTNLKTKIQYNLFGTYPQIIQPYQEKMKDMKKKYWKQSIFITSTTHYHESELLKFLKQIKIQLLRQSNMLELKKGVYDHFYDFLKQCERFKNEFQEYSNQTLKKSLKNSIILDEIRVKKIIHLMNRLTPYTLKLFNEQTSIYFNKPPFSIFRLQWSWLKNRKSYKQKVKEVVITKKDKIPKEKHQMTQVHLILQANYTSLYHYPYFMEMAEEVLSEQHLKVNMISCTDYHAIFGVYYAMGWKLKKIKQNYSSSQSFFRKNSYMDEDFKSENWMKSSIEQARGLMKRQFQRLHNPIDLLENEQYYINKGTREKQNKEKLIDFDHYQRNLEVQMQQFNESFQKLLNYVSGSLIQLSKLKKSQRVQRLQQLIGGRDAKQQQEKIEANSKRLMNKLLKFTRDFMMIAAQYIVKTQSYVVFDNQTWDTESIFKGLLLNSLVSAFNYKLYIFKLLQEAGYDKDVTLSRFYELNNHKILLNFNCVNTTQQRFSVINRFTRPNMPVWAALMAAASLPYLQGDFQSKKEWEIQQHPDVNIEQANQTFKKLDGIDNKRGNSYISSNFMSTLPLEFMTNHRFINSKYQLREFPKKKKDKPKQFPPIIQLVFAFENRMKITIKKSQDVQRKLTNILYHIPLNMDGKRRFLNIGDVCCQLGYFISHCCCMPGYKDTFTHIKTIFNKMTFLKMLQVRINAHDNLIVHMYYDKIIKLPLRIDTLDFHKIKRGDQSYILHDTIRQAEQTARQYFDTIRVNSDPVSKSLYSRSNTNNMETTIQISSHRYCKPQEQQSEDEQTFGKYDEKSDSQEIKLQEQAQKQAQAQGLLSQNKQKQKTYYRIKFISYTKWRDFKYKYAIQFSKNKKTWKIITKDYVDVRKPQLQSNGYKIWLRYTFYSDKKNSNTYQLDLGYLQHNLKSKDRDILRFQNSFIGSQTVKIFRLDKKNPDPKQIGQIKIDSIELPLSCPKCNIKHLKYATNWDEYDYCSKCQEKKLLCLKCEQCQARYCLNCKIQKFIVFQTLPDQNRFVFICPKYQNLSISKPNLELPLKQIRLRYHYRQALEKQNTKCLLCGMQNLTMWHEEDFSIDLQKGNEYSGFRICNPCMINVKQ